MWVLHIWWLNVKGTLKCSSSSSSQLDESAEHSELAQCLLGGEREGEREKECARLGDLQNKITKR